MVLSYGFMSAKKVSKKGFAIEPVESRFSRAIGSCEGFEIAVARGEDDTFFIVEGIDAKRRRWLLLCSSDIADGHKGTYEYWANTLKDITPLTGSTGRISEAEIRICGGSGTYRSRIANVSEHTRVLKAFFKGLWKEQ